MRMSGLFGKTIRQVPADAETASHQLLLRAGMVAQVSAGVYAYLPLGLRVLRRVEDVIREEMDACGGQELLMPSILPIDLYEQSGRDKTMGEILFRLKDHHEREFALGPTHEEAFVDVFKRNVQSYRDMPQMLYQVATKFRDEARPRGGLIRLRQFIMKDLYSFDVDYAGLDRSYQVMYEAYQRIFDRCSVPTVPVLADSGAMGGRDTHEFLYLTDVGEDHCLLCPKCGYAANAEVATFVKEAVHSEEEMEALQEVDTPGMKTIAELGAFLGCAGTKTAKAVFYVAALPAATPGEEGSGRKEGDTGSLREAPVLVVVRGDMDVNEAKLRQAVGAVELRAMDEGDVRKAGFVAGSAGPVGLGTQGRDPENPEPGAGGGVSSERAGDVGGESGGQAGSFDSGSRRAQDMLREPQGERVVSAFRGERGQVRAGALTHRTTDSLLVVADDLVTQERNLVSGANVADKHLLNVNYGRDWTADVVADVALAREGALCANCRTPMDERRGIEMGQVFKLGTRYSEAMGAYFLDAEGKQQPAVMGSYGIGVERLVAAVIEENHDENGIVWPALLAPFDVHLVGLQLTKSPETKLAAEKLYEELTAAGLRVLYDDRDESPGVKFNDADLLGMPVRATVSPRNLESGSVEVRMRAGGENELAPVDRAVEEIRGRVSG